MKTLVAAALLLTAGSAFAASGQSCHATITAGDHTRYNTDHLDIPQKSCPEFTLTFKHEGKMPVDAMGHNVVFTRTQDIDAVVTDGRREGGEQTDYLKPNDKRVIARTRMLGGGQEDTIKIDTSKFKAGEEYSFFCSYPGHPANMNGKVKLLNK